MEKNKMAVVPLKKLFLKMGLPMIISMVLQALYNVIDSIFITNMGSLNFSFSYSIINYRYWCRNWCWY